MPCGEIRPGGFAVLRFVASYLVAALLLPAVSAQAPTNMDLVNAYHPQSVGITVKSAFLCVTLTVTAPGDMHTWVSVDWGDGTVDEWEELACTPGCKGYLSHTYAIEGTYIVTVWESHLPQGTGSTRSLNVDDSPEFTLYSYAEGEDWIQLATNDSVYTATSPKSTIDWGDGGAIEEFNWDNCEGGGFCTPRHDYAVAGEYLIVARIEYLDFRGSTCYERVAIFQATIGTSSPVRNSTWGAVKSLYR